ncbi:MAG: tRNA (adenosine(37)-N6)-dimethylallyltransferase MiaA [Bacteroidales bacterium]
MPKLIVIVGPTGVGKTKLSLELAKVFECEIISSDSRQMYKEMKIGTAKPSEEELAEIKHHFIDNLSVRDYYNASQFEFEVLSLLQRKFKTCNTMIMAGGSMLYTDAVCKGIDELPTIDPEIRIKWKSIFEKEGLNSIRTSLKILDPEHYAEIDKKNHQRIIHALEIIEMTGQKFSSLRTNSIKKREFDISYIGLNINRDTLYKGINNRVDKMIETGLLEEVKSLEKFKDLPPLKTVGYKEIFEYMEKNTDLETSIEHIKRNTRRYAKKQLTWHKKNSNITWFEPGQTNEILQHINRAWTINSVYP